LKCGFLHIISITGLVILDFLPWYLKAIEPFKAQLFRLLQTCL
jgi:hypothetical protein